MISRLSYSSGWFCSLLLICEWVRVGWEGIIRVVGFLMGKLICIDD